MAGLLVRLKDLAENYDESDVTRILGGMPLANVAEQREALMKEVQEIRTRIEALLRVTAVWTYAEHILFRKIQEMSFMFIENLTIASDWPGDDSQLLRLAENYRRDLIECIDKTLSHTDNLNKTLSLVNDVYDILA